MLIRYSEDCLQVEFVCCLTSSSIDLNLKPSAQWIIFISTLLSLNTDHKLFF